MSSTSNISTRKHFVELNFSMLSNGHEVYFWRKFQVQTLHVSYPRGSKSSKMVITLEQVTMRKYPSIAAQLYCIFSIESISMMRHHKIPRINMLKILSDVRMCLTLTSLLFRPFFRDRLKNLLTNLGSILI